jgi:hypothetical protein
LDVTGISGAAVGVAVGASSGGMSMPFAGRLTIATRQGELSGAALIPHLRKRIESTWKRRKA